MWGTTQTVYLDDQVRVDRIVVRQGGYCSRHVHYRMDNGFLVITGVLLVCMEHRENRYLTMEDDAAVIPVGVVHHFEAMSDVVAIEFYRARPDDVIPVNEDIYRLSESGVRGDP